MFLPITGSFVLFFIMNQNFVEIPSGYNPGYLDRSYVAPVIDNTSFSAKKTNLVLVGANAYEVPGAHFSGPFLAVGQES